jgi:predicted DNA-binding protein (MmcQ/YjbR family)
MEDSIFKKYKMLENNLIPYGFTKNDKMYVYSKNILNNSFRVEVTIQDKVSVKVIDLEFGVEYTNYRRKNDTGEFVGKVRGNIEGILKDIRDKCFTKEYFVYPQSNRITKLIKEKYNDIPEFLWDDNSTGVFRNKKNKKWYAIIMYVNKNKLDNGSNEYVEVMNVKLDPEYINKLVDNQVYYRAYHMNKKYWMSIILNNIKNDKEIMELINKSYKYTE